MRHNPSALFGKAKLGALLALATGVTFGSVCSMKDVGNNLVSGSLSFMEAYTVDFLEALVPPADELITDPAS